MKPKKPLPSSSSRKTKQSQKQPSSDEVKVDWDSLRSPNPRYKGLTVRDVAKSLLKNARSKLNLFQVFYIIPLVNIASEAGWVPNFKIGDNRLNSVILIDIIRKLRILRIQVATWDKTALRTLCTLLGTQRLHT